MRFKKYSPSGKSLVENVFANGGEIFELFYGELYDEWRIYQP